MELMIVVVIVGILTTFAYPSYLESTRKSRRNDAKIALADLTSRMERFYTENNTYVGATIAAGAPTDVLSSANSADDQYTLSITTQTATAFAVSATPIAGTSQAGDGKCGTFGLTGTDQKTVSGTHSVDYCW